jgi:fatty acid desaturase
VLSSTGTHDAGSVITPPLHNNSAPCLTPPLIDVHDQQEWSWFRGALCTVDRSFGPVLDHVFHHISDTHVCHHIFSKMPFHAAQASGVDVCLDCDRGLLLDHQLRGCYSWPVKVGAPL